MLDKKITITLSIFSLLFINSCKNENNDNTIYTSFYPIYDFTSKIVGDKYKVINITPSGEEPHDFEPTPKDIEKLYDSDALLINGLNMEPWLDSAPKEIKNKAYVVTDSIITRKENNVLDPHVWLSIKNARIELKNIYEYILKLDPINKDYYENNYNEYDKKFADLQTDYKESLKDLTKPYLVTSHAAFGYLCDEFGLTQLYLSGLEPDATPTAKDIEKIINAVNKYKITTIFYEEMVGPEIANKIAKETGVKCEALCTLESLTKDEINNKEDYLTKMYDNLTKIKEATK